MTIITGSEPQTLPELLHAAPADCTAVILPEAGLRITYRSLRDQVMTMAETLAGLGIRRSDRVAIVLPNGLPAVVTFLAASLAGTAAPLNTEYRQEEFRFYLDDTSANLVLIPPDTPPAVASDATPAGAE